VRKILTALGAIVFAPALASAAEWKPLGNPPSGYADLSTIHQDNFLTATGMAFEMRTYLVAWLKFETEEGIILDEVAFNCRGGMEIVQQIASNDTANSRYHTFDNNKDLRITSPYSRGAQVKDIPPEGAFREAQNLICK
jgi:hypothetical protein